MGPLFLHVATRPDLEAAGVSLPPLDDVAADLAAGWLRAYGSSAA
jgi:hypothetical protein